jgi:hypothetical protein
MSDSSHLQRLRDALRAYYEQWRTLTETEGEAIVAGRWPQVEQLQKTKSQLQVQIEDAHRDLRSACNPSGAETRQIEMEFRPVVEHLLALEERNSRSLDAHKQRMTMQGKELRTAALTLRQVRQTYAPTRQALWQSYS